MRDSGGNIYNNIKDNKEGISIILEILEKDKNLVMLYTAFCLAIPSITLTGLNNPDSLNSLQISTKIGFVVSLFFFLVAGGLFALYAWRVHMGIWVILNLLMRKDSSEFSLDELYLKIFSAKVGYVPKGVPILYAAWILLALAFVVYLFFIFDYINVL